MRWPEYPRYKDSGVEWLGKVPEHWDIRKLKYISSIQFSNVDKHAVKGEKSVRLCNYVDVYHNDFITADLNFMEATAPPDQIAKFALSAGDVIITKDSESWDDIAVPAYVSSNMHDVLCGYHLAQIRTNQKWAHGKYLFRAFCSRGVNDQFRVAATGITRYGLGKYWLDNGLFLVPPVNEQRAIAAFLDRETGRIDALIEKKQRQIELLQEKRAALISHTITKGLDPSATLKNSGLAWIGQIPVKWELKRLKFLIEFVTSGSRGWAQYYSDEGAIFLRIGNLSRFSLDINLSDVQFVEPPGGAEVKRTRIKEGDVLISITAYVGSVSVIEEDIGEAYVNQHIALTRPLLEKVEPNWLGYVLLSEIGQYQFRIQLYGGTKEGFGLDDVKDLLILLPPPYEQRDIVSFLNQEIHKIDTLITRIRDSIDQLKEYRTALISAAVTGKIDVRGEVRQVPAAFSRIVLAAEIVDRLHNDPNFHRVKFQKVLYLCEHHLGMDLEGNYWRQAAGPLDNRMLYSLENQMQRQKWFAPRKSEQGIRYVPMKNAEGHRKYFDAHWAEYREGLDSLLELMRPLNTQQSEIVATLFAAWNDLIIAGLPFTDEDILYEVRVWHKSKQRFGETQLRRALKWMRDKGLVPQGLGKLTRK